MRQFRSFASHSFAAILEAGLIATLLVGLIAVPALAAKGGGGGKTPSATMELVLVESADAVASHGDRVTFTVSTTVTDRPFVVLKCWQGTTGVYNKSIGIFPTYMFDPWFTLDSSYWTPGVEATCTARAYYYDKRGNQKDLATMQVTVAP